MPFAARLPVAPPARVAPVRPAPLANPPRKASAPGMAHSLLMVPLASTLAAGEMMAFCAPEAMLVLPQRTRPLPRKFNWDGLNETGIRGATRRPTQFRPGPSARAVRAAPARGHRPLGVPLAPLAAAHLVRLGADVDDQLLAGLLQHIPRRAVLMPCRKPWLVTNCPALVPAARNAACIPARVSSCRPI